MKSPTTKNSKFFSNEKGFSLTEIMIAGGMLGVLALVSVQLTKNSSDVQHKGTVDTDIKTFKANFSSIIYNPAHCNANFYAASNSPGFNNSTQLFTCSGTATQNCRDTGGTRTQAYVVNTTNWNSPGFSNRVRIKSITRSYSYTSVLALSPATITVVLETRPSSNPSAPTIDETIEFKTAVVTNSPNVLGCPKSVNTTNLY